MVFFTCNHCGESVKKPSVDKHYNTKCRGAPKSVSCMDCQKDFQDNYVEHVKCITEMEKYSGKDYVPKESANSGAKKQEGWVETVRAVLDSSDYQMSGPTRQAFIMLQKYDNVPRKKAKFLNFVTNSVHIPRKTVEEVWSILEKEQEKLKQAKQQQLEAKKAEKQVKENKENDGGEEAPEKKQKLELNGNDEAEKTEESKVKLSKQEKKLKKQQKTEAMEQVVDEVAEVEVKEEKAAKKQKNKHTKADEVTENEEKALPQKKKKKDKAQQNGMEVDEEQPKQNGEAAGNKKQKKRANEEAIEAADVNSPKKSKLNGVEETVDKTTANGKTAEADEYAFCWDYEFQHIMSKHADGLVLDKLKKKILKKYKTKFDDELTERQLHGFEKKFNKKLKKNSSLKLEDDIVKLVA